MGKKGLTDVSQILTRSGRDIMGPWYAKRNKSCQYLLSFEHTAERGRHRNRPPNGNIVTNRRNRFQQCRL